MSGEKVSFEDAAASQSAGDARHNDRSSIAFPYLDLDTAVEVARAVYERAGHSGCEIDELAAQMKQTVSGAFRQKTATAKLFGVLGKEDRSSFNLTDIGRRIVRPETEKGARAEAFLEVPLYKAIYERYRGHHLPPAKALERELAALGVAPKQTDKARQTFERSARQAGFFEHGEGRLVMPRADRPEAIESAPAIEVAPAAHIAAQPSPNHFGGGGGEPPSGDKPLEYQLLDLMKREPDLGDEVRQAIWTLLQFLTTRQTQKRKDPEKDPSDSG